MMLTEDTQSDPNTTSSSSSEPQPTATSSEDKEHAAPSTSVAPSNTNGEPEILTAVLAEDEQTQQNFIELWEKKIKSNPMELNKDLSYIVQDYLTRRQEPAEPIQCSIRKLLNRVEDLAFRRPWLEICCKMFAKKSIFNEWYKLLIENPQITLKGVLESNTDILMANCGCVMERLTEVTDQDYTFLHKMVMDTRNGRQQTIMFTTSTFVPWVKLYREEGENDNRFLDLCELLKERDADGQTALHTNPSIIAEILKYYTTIHEDELVKLIEMKNGRKEKAFNNSDELSYLRDHLKNNRYLLYGRPSVLMFSTIKDRPGAEEEANSIQKAFQNLKVDGKPRFEVKPVSKDEPVEGMIQKIEEEALAEEWENSGVPKSAFIVVLMTHGLMGEVYDYESHSKRLKDIEEAMCPSHLSGKPKILIAQCCQEIEDNERDGNTSYDPSPKPKTEIPHFDAKKIPYSVGSADFCALMASVPGGKAKRNIFIKEIADQLGNLPKDKGTPINKIFQDATQKMKAKGIEQTSLLSSTLQGEFAI